MCDGDFQKAIMISQKRKSLDSAIIKSLLPVSQIIWEEINIFSVQFFL